MSSRAPPEPQNHSLEWSTDTVMTDDGLLLRYQADRLVGVTVLDA